MEYCTETQTQINKQNETVKERGEKKEKNLSFK